MYCYESVTNYQGLSIAYRQDANGTNKQFEIRGTSGGARIVSTFKIHDGPYWRNLPVDLADRERYLREYIVRQLDKSSGFTVRNFDGEETVVFGERGLSDLTDGITQ